MSSPDSVTLTPGEARFVDSVGEYYASDGYPFDRGRVIGWMIICDPPRQRVEDLCRVLGVERDTVDRVADFLARSGLFQRFEEDGDGYSLMLADDAWSETILHTFRNWHVMADALRFGVEVLADAPARRRRVENLAALYAHLAREMPPIVEGYHRLKERRARR